MDEFEDPQWLRASVFFLVAGVAALGFSGLLLAVIDRYSFGLAVALAAVVFAGLCWASRALLPRQGRPSEIASVCAVLVVLARDHHLEHLQCGTARVDESRRWDVSQCRQVAF